MTEPLPIDLLSGIYFKVGNFSVIEVSAPTAPKQEVHELLRDTEFVFVIDGSGSMGRDTSNITRLALSCVMTQAGYKEENKVTLIIFASTVYLISLTIAELRQSKISSGGGTYMRDTFCLRFIKNPPGGTRLHICFC
jgi:hypothetical protein